MLRRRSDDGSVERHTQPQAETREFTSLSLFTAQNNATGESVRVFPTRDAIDAFRATQAGQRSTQAGTPLTVSRRPDPDEPEDVRRLLGLGVERQHRRPERRRSRA